MTVVVSDHIYNGENVVATFKYSTVFSVYKKTATSYFQKQDNFWGKQNALS